MKQEVVKPEENDDVKPKLEASTPADGPGTNGHHEDTEALVKQEEDHTGSGTAPRPTPSKRVTFAEDVEKSSKKRAAGSEESEDADADDEPPSKKQRKKAAPKAEKKELSKTKAIKVEEDEESVAEEPAPQKQGKKNTIGTSKAPHEKPNGKAASKTAKKAPSPPKLQNEDVEMGDQTASDVSEAEADEESEEEAKPEEAAKARQKVQTTLKSISKDPYPDWKAGDPVPYAALCTTFSKIEMTTKRLEISAHCSLFLRQVLRLTPKDLLQTVLMMLGKLAADYAGIELGIGESLIMKSIGETTGRSLQVIKADQQEIGDLGLVAAKSRSNQPTMFKPKPLTVRAVHEGLMQIALVEGQGSQGKKVAAIKKLLSAADIEAAGKGKNAVDITKDKGGPSESKFIVRTLEGKMRLGLADKTILQALADAMIYHDVFNKSDKPPNSEQIAKGENILKNVYK